MKKYYIPTTSLNFNNILSSESVSPHSFFERRGFGYPRWFNIPENPLENSIVLYENFGCFDLPVTDVESHPMIIEVCLPDDEIETLLQLDNHIFLCDHTIYLDPKSSRFLFFDEEYLRITLSLSDASLETKMVKLYERRIQTVGKPEYCYPPISTGERQELNLSAIEFDKSLNKMKGLLYGFYIGSLLSSSREMVVQLKTYLSIKNVFAAILASSDHKATPAQLEQLSALFAIVQPPVPFLEKLKSILNDESVYQAVAKLVRGEYGYIRGEYDVHRIVNNLLAEPVDPEAENPELKKILNAIDVLEKNIRISAPKADVDSCPILVSEGKSSRLNIDDVPPEERELYIYWVNEVLSSEVYNGKISTFKNELSDEIAKASKVFFGQNWDSSPKRVLLNEIRSFVRGQSFEHVWANDIYSSIAAVMAKGDDWQGLLQFMRQKEMFDYRIAFSFYGVLNGFANLSRDFTDILFDGDKKYTWTVYQDFYGQLLSRNIPDSALAPTSPVTSSEEIDDLPPDEDMPDFTAGNASSPDSSKEQADTEDDASIPLEVFLADIYTLCPGAKKDENVYRRLYAEHDGINLDFAYAVYNDTKLNQGKGVQKKIRKYSEEGPQPKKDEKKSRTTSNQEDGSLNLFDGSVPSTGVFLDDFDFLVNNSEFRGLASKAKKKWIDDLRWFIDAHRPGSQEFERYYKDKPLDNETVIRQFVRLKNGVYKRTEEWLKNTYHLF